jgi:hypothetical protein
MAHMVANPARWLGESEMGTVRMRTDAAIPGTGATLQLIFVFWSWQRDFSFWVIGAYVIDAFVIKVCLHQNRATP